MTSIRADLLITLRDRLQAAQEDWHVALRTQDNVNTSEARVTALIAQESIRKRIENSEQYQATMTAVVVVTAFADDADDVTHEGNGYIYLDELLADVERVVHAPDTWGDDPAFTDVTVTEIQVRDDEAGGGTVMGLVRLEWTYRHSYQDPDSL